jgi:hypothetical protein
VDLDPTDDPTHGQQELSFFNGHYDTWCYLPLVATLTFNAEPQQYLVAAVLRPATAPPRGGCSGYWPACVGDCARRFRASAPASGSMEVLPAPRYWTFWRATGVEYLVAMASNARLVKRVRRLMGRARMRSKAGGDAIPGASTRVKRGILRAGQHGGVREARLPRHAIGFETWRPELTCCATPRSGARGTSAQAV